MIFLGYFLLILFLLLSPPPFFLRSTRPPRLSGVCSCVFFWGFTLSRWPWFCRLRMVSCTATRTRHVYIEMACRYLSTYRNGMDMMTVNQAEGDARPTGMRDAWVVVAGDWARLLLRAPTIHRLSWPTERAAGPSRGAIDGTLPHAQGAGGTT